MTVVLLMFAVGAIAYIYVGYPLLLACIVRVRGPRAVRHGGGTPAVSLVISAFNEGAVIRRKILNALALDYPVESLEIVVVSDASSDSTDAVVAEYADRGVRLLRQPARGGKTAGLNAALPLLAGEVVVFSDANAMYDPQAVRHLVRNFADPSVGCVTGEARYLPGGTALADVAERVYWNYEARIKRLETAVGSMVGGDGAIYAIRRSLWRTLPTDAINDFLNPLQIACAGWRAVYEPRAVCHEETAGDAGAEYRRRVRIVSRSWRAVFQTRGVFSPARVGLFAWCLVSHKVLRWFSGAFAAIAAIAVVSLGAPVVLRHPLPAAAVALGAGAAIATIPAARRAAGMFGYFVIITAASLVGIARGMSGRVSGIWTTPRADVAAISQAPRRVVPVGPIFLAAVGTTLVAAAVIASSSPDGLARTAFWGSIAMLAYVYAGYPLLLAALRPTPHPAAGPLHEPSVCIFIAANDEASIIEAKLLNTLSIDYPRSQLDIVVASDGSVDDTNAIVTRFEPFGVRLLNFSERRGKIAAINEGMRSVRSDIVVLSDANTFLDPMAVRALVRGFADDQVGAISGDVTLEGERARLGPSEDMYYRYERWIQRAESDINSLVGVDGALYALRRTLFVPQPDDTILDDMAIPMAVIRAGRRVRFEPEARAHERGSETAREEFARKSRVIAGAVQFLCRRDSGVPAGSLQVMLSMISHKGLRWLSPAFGIALFCASVLLTRDHGAYASAAVAQAGVAGLGVIGCIPAMRRFTVIGVSHYFCLVQTAAAVGLVRGIRGRQSVRWRRFGRTDSLGGVACAK